MGQFVSSAHSLFYRYKVKTGGGQCKPAQIRLHDKELKLLLLFLN